ncbi:MAG TPA: lamin tail domain-containing protein, partial [Patescibacteria group bacterium]|nr:lamin tail domain-containing protein [Patescibacteria group bacterium]
APEILAFTSHDPITGNRNYTSSTTIDLNLEIKNEKNAQGFLTTTSPEKPEPENNSWATSAPEVFQIASNNSTSEIYFYLKYRKASSAPRILKASSTVNIKADPPAPTITNLVPQDGVYWLNNNTYNLAGGKGTLTKEIIFKNQNTSATIQVATGTVNWSLNRNFGFQCPTTSFRYLDENWESCPELYSRMKKGEGVYEFLKDFHQKNFALQAKDIFGQVSSSSEFTFKLDLSPPEIKSELVGFYSQAGTGILLSEIATDKFLHSPHYFPEEVVLDSGIKKKIWEYARPGEPPLNWSRPDTKSVEILSHKFQYFQGQYGQDYIFRLKLRDFAGNITTSTPEQNYTVNLTTSAYPVISEIYANASTTESGGEWIELYNPSNRDIDLSGFTIDTASYQPDVTLPAGSILRAHSFFLISDEDWIPDKSDWPKPDYEEIISLRNSGGFIRLNNAQGKELDYVSYNSLNPLQSAERKAYLHSTPEEMSPGGSHHDKGNGWDTDNDRDDWIIQDTPNPQSSSSTPEKWSF